MIPAIAFLALPLSHLYAAYQSVNSTTKVTMRGLLPGSSTVELNINEWAEGNPGQIVPQDEWFLRRFRVRPDLHIILMQHAQGCCAEGNNWGRSATIFMHPGLQETDPDAFRWLLKHEICHIQKSHNVSRMLAGVIASTALGSVFFSVMKTSTAFFITFAITPYFTTAISRDQEREADRFANRLSSDSELRGGIRFLMAIQEANICKRSKAPFWEKIFTSPSGEKRLGLSHPSCAARIQEIQRVLRLRGNKETYEPTKEEVNFLAKLFS